MQDRAALGSRAPHLPAPHPHPAAAALPPPRHQALQPLPAHPRPGCARAWLCRRRRRCCCCCCCCCWLSPEGVSDAGCRVAAGSHAGVEPFATLQPRSSHPLHQPQATLPPPFSTHPQAGVHRRCRARAQQALQVVLRILRCSQGRRCGCRIRIEGGQQLLELMSTAQPTTVQADHLVCGAMQLQHRERAGLLVQAVHVLSDERLPPACRQRGGCEVGQGCTPWPVAGWQGGMCPT